MTRPDARAILRHAAEFTATENTALVECLRGWFSDEFELGDRVWSTRSLQEHFESKLDIDPALRTPDEVRCLELLKAEADAAQAALDAKLGGPRRVSVGINQELWALVARVSAQMEPPT